MINKKVLGRLFISIASSFIGLGYWKYMSHDHSNRNSDIFSLIYFHVQFILLV